MHGFRSRRPLAPAAGLLALLAALGAAGPVAAQPEPEAASSLADMQAFRAWLGDYSRGAIRMMHELEIDQAALADAEARMAKLAAWNDMNAAKALFDAAVVDPRPAASNTASDILEFQSELLPWRIRSMARRHVAAMQVDGLDAWLIGLLDNGKLRDADADADRTRVDAALRILGARGSTGGKLALLRASRAMPPKLRLRAIDVLSETADLGLVESFVDILRDKESELRIAALNALGNALAEHTDETRNDSISDDIAKLRDETIAAMREVLVRDKVWQVRSAAASNLAKLRTRFALPALIDGYEAELGRRKEPWAMDARLHGLLEGLTGLGIPFGDARPWREFWKKEGASFRFAREGAQRQRVTDSRYEKFFSIDLDSDRVLFVVDFSGSMREPVTLHQGTTSAQAGTTATKAQIVLEELRRIVLALPDGSYFNVIVFSDGVRVWRPARGGNPELVRIDDESRDDLLGNFLESIEPRGPTNLYDALDTALGFAGQGLKDQNYALGFDTVYVLSDGAPSYGRVIDKDEIRRLVRETNRLKRLTIHCVTFGQKNDTDFLRLLAEENGGRHIHVE
ncbi:MAG: VWA domain-containing protein [Planctomycetes bacterium]|nr:VWA domain-containing protein [Planctomycetota bacterium]